MSIRTIKVGSFAGVISTDRALAVIPPQNGVVQLSNVNFFADAVGTYKILRPRHRTTANAAVTADTALPIVTDSNGYVGGKVISTSDFVLVADTSGTGWQLIAISAVGAVASSVVELTLASNVEVASGDYIYIVRAEDILSRATTADENRVDAKDQGTSFDNMPIAVEIAATGSNTLSGTYDVVR